MYQARKMFHFFEENSEEKFLQIPNDMHQLANYYKILLNAVC